MQCYLFIIIIIYFFAVKIKLNIVLSCVYLHFKCR